MTELHLSPVEGVNMLGIQLVPQLNAEGKPDPSLPPVCSPSRAVNAYGKLDLSPSEHRRWYHTLAGSQAVEVEDRIVGTVVGYIVQDTAKGLPLNVVEAVDRAKALAERYPGSFTVTAASERSAARAKAREERQAELSRNIKARIEAGESPEKVKAELEAPKVKGKRGRPSLGEESVFAKVTKEWLSATDRSKEAFIAHLVVKLSLNAGTAQTYYYKAKKEVAIPDAV